MKDLYEWCYIYRNGVIIGEMSLLYPPLSGPFDPRMVEEIVLYESQYKVE